MQGARAAVHPHSILDSAVGGELALECLDFAAQNELAIGDDIGNRLIDFVLDASVLSFQIYKRNHNVSLSIWI